MQDNYKNTRKEIENKDSKLLYKSVADIFVNCRKQKNIKYTEFCYENDIPVSTYNDIITAKGKASFYKIAKIVKGLNMNFTEFGSLLDAELPKEFWDIE